jgi:hypothetical protein
MAMCVNETYYAHRLDLNNDMEVVEIEAFHNLKKKRIEGCM